MLHPGEYDGKSYKLIIDYDDSSESPREWDNLFTFVCWHNRYRLGDKNHGFSDPEDFFKYAEKKRTM